MQEISKDTDQTVRMRKLTWGFAGLTYDIVGNLISRLKLLIWGKYNWLD